MRDARIDPRLTQLASVSWRAHAVVSIDARLLAQTSNARATVFTDISTDAVCKLRTAVAPVVISVAQTDVSAFRQRKTQSGILARGVSGRAGASVELAPVSRPTRRTIALETIRRIDAGRLQMETGLRAAVDDLSRLAVGTGETRRTETVDVVFGLDASSPIETRRCPRITFRQLFRAVCSVITESTRARVGLLIGGEHTSSVVMTLAPSSSARS